MNATTEAGRADNATIDPRDGYAGLVILPAGDDDTIGETPATRMENRTTAHELHVLLGAAGRVVSHARTLYEQISEMLDPVARSGLLMRSPELRQDILDGLHEMERAMSNMICLVDGDFAGLPTYDDEADVDCLAEETT